MTVGKYLLRLVLAIFFISFLNPVFSQDRFSEIEKRLKELSMKTPGLNENVELSVNEVSIQEFIQGIGNTHKLNLSVDAKLDTKITNNFSSVTVSDVLLFLCRKYNLNISFIGAIMSITPYIEEVSNAPHVININYDKQADLLNLDLKNDSLSIVVKELTKATGRNVLMAPDLSGKMVSGFIQNMSFGNGLSNFFTANDLRITATDENAFLIEKKDKEPGGEKSNIKGEKKNTKSISSITGLTVSISQDTLLNVEANNVQIADMLSGISALQKKNYFLYSEIKGTATLSLKNVTFDDFLKFLLNGTEYTFRKDGNLYLFGDRTIEGLRGTKMIQLKYRTADKIIDIIPAEMKKGVDIKAFPDLNGVIVSGSQPRIDEIESFLTGIDKIVPVVVIEVLIVDVRNSRTVTTGIKAGLGTEPAKTGGTVFPGVDLTLSSSSINSVINGINGLGVVNLGKVTPNFYLSLKALEEQGYLKLRSTPKLATLNGHEAKLSIGRTEYYQETQTTILGTINSGSQTAITYKPVNADLSVTINPMVSGDEQITLDIKVKQSNFTERIAPTAPPGTITRDFESLVRVKNDEMIILGGLEESTKNDTGSGVPLLSRIPVLKWFFSSRTKTKGENKLTIFIKPTVIY